jgi:hypothetical protein
MGAQRDNRQVYESIKYSIHRLAPRSWADRSGVNWRGLPTAMQNARQAPRPSLTRRLSPKAAHVLDFKSETPFASRVSGVSANRSAFPLGVSYQLSFGLPAVIGLRPRWPTTSPRSHFSWPAKQS